MDFMFYDLTFLVLFSFAIGIFLYRNRRKVKREMGIVFLYKSQAGVRFINYVGGKYKKTLNALKYLIIPVSYILMGGILYLIGKSVYIYIRHPILMTNLVKAPPIAPLIPYFPKLFNMESFFPPFYFTYFIIAIGIVAVVHEFAHGIYMKYNNIRIKSTGVAFFGPIPGAFVEQDEKDMKKTGKINQMSVLGAGVFANVVVALLFFLIWMGIFHVAFVPSGAMFDNYIASPVDVNSIDMIGGIVIQSLTSQEIVNLIDKNNLTNDLVLGTNGNSLSFTKIVAKEKSYFMTVELLKEQLELEEGYVVLYEDFPAINVGLRGSIIDVDGTEIKNHDEFIIIMQDYNAGDKINIKTKFEDEVFSYNFSLGENPSKKGEPMIGISNQNVKMGTAENLAFFKEKFTDYEVKNNFLFFLYYLAFWTFLINLLVAFFNMLPASILDGGQFFYLTILGLTKNEKSALKITRWMGRIILFAFVLMLVMWIFGIAN